MNQRPMGVTILAIGAFILGGLSLLAGVTLLGFGGLLAAAGFGGLAIFFAIYGLAWGALTLWIGWGWWNLKPSSWRWGIILMAVGIIVSLVQLVLGYGGGAIGGGIVSIAIGVVIIYYLTTPAVRAAFGQPTGGSMTDAVMGAFGMGGKGAASAAPAAPPAAPPPASSWTPPAESAAPPAASAWTPPAEPAAPPPAESAWTPPAESGGDTAMSGDGGDEGESA